MSPQITGQTATGAVWWRRIYTLVLFLFGATLSIGGVMLIADGGSPYYLLAGLGTTVAAVLLARGQRLGAWVYGAVLIGTLAWSFAEVGAVAWSLVPRLVAPLVLGIPLIFASRSGQMFGGARTFVAACVVAVVAGLGLHAAGPAAPVDPLYALGRATKAPDALPRPLATLSGGEWRQYGNDAGGTRFSPLTQITPQNVEKLEVAWEADLGPATSSSTAGLEVTPINVGGSLYACNGYNTVMALDAATGKERWRFDMSEGSKATGKPCRGVSYFKVPGASGVCAERILATSQIPALFALDAATGQRCAGFGADGKVDLLTGMGKVPDGYYYVSSAPQIVRGKAIFGGAVMDGQFWGEPSGVIRAYDATTGRFAWAFDIGRQQDHAEPAPGASYTDSTPNSWAPLSADEGLGLVYLPTGNATPDYYGGQRRPFDDQLSSSVIALDVDTGALRWHFQTTHHDLWDYDVPAQPTLVDLPTATGVRAALIQPTKRGEIFVLDRVTGEPIRQVTEVPAPQGDIPPGERLSQTQPFSTGMPSFRGAVLRESDMWGTTPIDQMMCRILFKRSRYEGPLTPPSLDKPGIYDPGNGGGINWGSVAIDVDRGLMMVNATRVPGRVEVITRAEARERGFKLFDGQKQGSPVAPQEQTPYAAAPGNFLSPLGVPCNAPPWGTLTAVDLANGQVVWSKPLGDGRDSGPFGIRSHIPLTMGVPNIGGSVVTRGGLTFIGATTDGMFRAFDSATGKLLWQARLPGGGQATPMSFQAPDGRQLVVIAAGGKPSLKTRMSNKMVAYALPR